MSNFVEHTQSGFNDCFKLCTEQLQEWKQLFDEYFEDEEEKETELNKIKNIAKDYCDKHFEYEKKQFALNKAKNSIQADSEVDLKNIYEENLRNDTRKCFYNKYDFYKRLFDVDDDDIEVLEESHLEDDEQNEPAEYENLGDSMLCSQVFTPPVDPITKKVITDPCRNKKCGHIYEYETITSFIKVRGARKTKCPYVGCSNEMMSTRFLQKDTKLKERIIEYNNKH